MQFSNRLNEKKEILLIYFNCDESEYVLSISLTVPWVGLQSVILGFPGHACSLFDYFKFSFYSPEDECLKRLSVCANVRFVVSVYYKQVSYFFSNNHINCRIQEHNKPNNWPSDIV